MDSKNGFSSVDSVVNLTDDIALTEGELETETGAVMWVRVHAT